MMKRILATDWWRQQDPVFTTGDPASTFSRSYTAYRHYPIGDETRLEEVGSDILRCSWQKNPDMGLWIRGFHSEPGRTNKIYNNCAIDNATWSKIGCSVTDNSIILPDGNTSNYDTLHEDTSLGQHRISDASASLAAGPIVFSAYVYPLGRTKFQLGGSTDYAFFDLADASVYFTSTNIVDADVEDLGGWLRIWWSMVAGAGGQWFHLLALKDFVGNSYQGEDIDSCMCWGMQIEEGEYPSSLIVTGASPVSRTEDSDYQVAAPLPAVKQGWLSTKVYITPHTNSAEIPILTLSDGGSAADRIRLAINTSQNLELQSACSGGDAGLVEAGSVMDGRTEGHDVYLTWRPGELCLAVDGVFGTSDHVVSIPDNLDQLNIHPSGAIVGDVQMGDKFSRVPWRFLAAA